jgi:uncharacterized membrane protein YeiH
VDPVGVTVLAMLFGLARGVLRDALVQDDSPVAFRGCPHIITRLRRYAPLALDG